MENSYSNTKLSSHKRFLIENDLFARYKLVKQKIDLKKMMIRKRETAENQDTPKINNRSKKIAKSLKRTENSLNRLEKTREILRNSRFMPKKIRISINDLRNDKSKSMKKVSNLDLNILSSRMNSPQFYPSLIHPSGGSSGSLPEDIKHRNDLLFSLRQETSSRGFILEPVDPCSVDQSIHERSKVWLLKKQEKINEIRKNNEKNLLVGCTFKPILTQKSTSFTKNRNSSSASSYSDQYSKKKLYRSFLNTKASYYSRVNISESVKNTRQAIATPRSDAYLSSLYSPKPYSNLSPIKVSLKYETGFSRKFESKAMPMLNYSKLKLNSMNL
jgi:hypothetical protein